MANIDQCGISRYSIFLARNLTRRTGPTASLQNTCRRGVRRGLARPPNAAIHTTKPQEVQPGPPGPPLDRDQHNGVCEDMELPPPPPMEESDDEDWRQPALVGLALQLELQHRLRCPPTEATAAIATTVACGATTRPPPWSASVGPGPSASGRPESAARGQRLPGLSTPPPPSRGKAGGSHRSSLWPCSRPWMAY